ncbi:Hypothetical predicted protein [Octopus vulgaris]|uniref:Uncharacterized protein n=1 Tax=Octopus vulgaris TaxID=6645 RepID=A0AA36B3A4_OCTVU|nr:Hypothetical predicted protein [Octopus vulgaris]
MPSSGSSSSCSNIEDKEEKVNIRFGRRNRNDSRIDGNEQFGRKKGKTEYFVLEYKYGPDSQLCDTNEV